MSHYIILVEREGENLEKKQIDEKEGEQRFFSIMDEKQKFSTKKSSIYEKWSEPGNAYTSVTRHPGDRNGYNNFILFNVFF